MNHYWAASKINQKLKTRLTFQLKYRIRTLPASRKWMNLTLFCTNSRRLAPILRLNNKIVSKWMNSMSLSQPTPWRYHLTIIHCRVSRLNPLYPKKSRNFNQTRILKKAAEPRRVCPSTLAVSWQQPWQRTQMSSSFPRLRLILCRREKYRKISKRSSNIKSSKRPCPRCQNHNTANLSTPWRASTAAGLRPTTWTYQDWRVFRGSTIRPPRPTKRTRKLVAGHSSPASSKTTIKTVILNLHRIPGASARTISGKKYWSRRALVHTLSSREKKRTIVSGSHGRLLWNSNFPMVEATIISIRAIWVLIWSRAATLLYWPMLTCRRSSKVVVSRYSSKAMLQDRERIFLLTWMNWTRKTRSWSNASRRKPEPRTQRTRTYIWRSKVT